MGLILVEFQVKYAQRAEKIRNYALLIENDQVKNSGISRARV